MADIAMIGTITTTSAGSPFSIAVTRADVQAGDLLLFWYQTDSGAVTPTVTDNRGNTYSLVNHATAPGPNDLVDTFTFIAVAGTTASTTTTASSLGGVNFGNGALAVVRNGDTTTPYGVSAQNWQLQATLPSGTDNVTTGSMTPTSGRTGYLIVGMSSDVGGLGGIDVPAAGTGFTSQLTFWPFAGRDTTIVETKRVTSSAAAAALFSSQDTSDYLNPGVILNEPGTTGGGNTTPALAFGNVF